MEDEALEVLTGVVEGDETSVEGWYLGGWGLWLLAERAGERQEVEPGTEDGGAEIVTNNKKSESESNKKGPKPSLSTQDGEKVRITHLRDSRAWLNTCLSLAAQLDYEDDRLRDHAQELVQEIERLLLERGVALEDDEDEWEGVDSSEEEEGEEDDDDGDNKDVEEANYMKSGRRDVGNAEAEQRGGPRLINDVIMSDSGI